MKATGNDLCIGSHFPFDVDCCLFLQWRDYSRYAATFTLHRLATAMARTRDNDGNNNSKSFPVSTHEKERRFIMNADERPSLSGDPLLRSTNRFFWRGAGPPYGEHTVYYGHNPT
jgi:hypothetical protein